MAATILTTAWVAEDETTYTCHAGKCLSPLYTRKQKSKIGYESEVTVYEHEGCNGCPYKEKCAKAMGNKKLYLSKSSLEKDRNLTKAPLVKQVSVTG